MNKSDKLKPELLKKLLVKVRIEILFMLYKKDLCACEIVKHTELKNNLISHHLKVLLDMGYVESKRNGKHIMYKLKPSKRDVMKEIFNLIDTNNLNY